MKNLNIFIENIHTQFEIDEVQVLSNLKKITNFIIEQEDIVSRSCLNGYDYETLCFDVVFCDDAKIHEINREYRQKDRPTDIISFAIFADSLPGDRFVFDDEINLGEIIVSLDKIKEQAEDNNHSFESELYFLLAHGVLHCLGFDHLTDEDFDFMMDTQNKSKVVLSV